MAVSEAEHMTFQLWFIHRATLKVHNLKCPFFLLILTLSLCLCL